MGYQRRVHGGRGRSVRINQQGVTIVTIGRVRSIVTERCFGETRRIQLYGPIRQHNRKQLTKHRRTKPLQKETYSKLNTRKLTTTTLKEAPLKATTLMKATTSTVTT